jgi:two-component system nitrogen regulation response regulator GlnG
MQTICKQIGRIAAQDISVLILGESGTGKELVARAIYHHSLRSQQPFLAINCAAIPESLLESELFGHERGAFTGADRRRVGKFEQSNGGTLLLDEVGDMSPSTQAKILRVLQERRFERVGGNESLSVDVRLVAATNQNLENLISNGRFRRDLYYRLRGVTIQLPPLRDRREDIAELAHYFLFRYNRQLGTAVQSIAPAAMELLEQYGWPGNVRELESAIREALITSSGMTILPEFLPAEVRHEPATHPDLDTDESPVGDIDWQSLPKFVEKAIGGNETDVYRRARDQFDRLLILRAMQHTGGNQNRAAEILGLSRVTLRARLRAMKGLLD